MKQPENVARGYKAAMKNRNVSNEGREHARNELSRLESHEEEEGQESDQETQRHDANVKRGLKAATHNPNVTDMGKQQARGRLESMGEHPQQPGD